MKIQWINNSDERFHGESELFPVEFDNASNSWIRVNLSEVLGVYSPADGTIQPLFGFEKFGRIINDR